MQNICHLSKLIFEQAKRYGERTALRYRDYDVNQWIPISWNQFASKVKKVSYALLRLGVKPRRISLSFLKISPKRFSLILVLTVFVLFPFLSMRPAVERK